MRAPDYTVAEFTAALLALLPTGRAWPRDEDTVRAKLLSGLADAFADNSAAAKNLLTQVFPATAVDLLAEWEAALGLPGPFGVLSGTTSGRQAAVVAALTNTGGQSKAYIIALAAGLGFTITISEFKPWGVDQGISTPIYGDGTSAMFVVHAPIGIATSYSPGPDIDIVQAVPGLGNPQLEAMLSAVKPANSICVTSYT